jgi:hypothetical protein
MFRLSAVVGVAFLGAAMLVSTGLSQDKKDKDKIKGMLPPGWKKLDLSKDQIAKIYEVQTKFRADFKKLEDQINELKTKERAEMVKHLTEDQKELLRKLTIGEEKKDKEVKKDKGDKEKS